MLNELIIQDKKITWRKIKYKKISDPETHKNKKGAQIRVFPPKTPLMVLSKKISEWFMTRKPESLSTTRNIQHACKMIYSFFKNFF